MQNCIHEFDPNLRVNENQKSYQELKQESIRASNYYHTLGLYDKANKLNDCGTFLEFLTNSTVTSTKLNRANFCRDRFCPFCADRLKFKNQLKLGTILAHLNDTQPDIKYIFLTLTTPNVPKEGLEQELNALNRGFNQLIKSKQLAQYVLGYVKSMHVTYKCPYRTNGNTYHPHLHVLIAMDSSFNQNTRKYYPKSKWLELWQQCRSDVKIDADYGVKVDYLNSFESVEKVANYIAKPLEDHLVNFDCFSTMTSNLKGRRLLEFTGIFRDLSREFDNGKLDNYMKKNTTYYTHLMCSTWHFKNKMYESQIRPLDEVELLYFNRVLGDY